MSTTRTEVFERKHDRLVRVFDRFVRSHPSVLEEIPPGAVLVFQVEGETAFNEWSAQIARSVADPGQPLLYLVFTLNAPAAKRVSLRTVEKLQLEPVGL
jgi:hypothetical protein